MSAGRSASALLRAMLIGLGILLLPMAAWFAHRGIGRYWREALALAVVGGLFLRVGLARGDGSWLAAIDAIDGGPNR